MRLNWNFYRVHGGGFNTEFNSYQTFSKIREERKSCLMGHGGTASDWLIANTGTLHWVILSDHCTIKVHPYKELLGFNSKIQPNKHCHSLVLYLSSSPSVRIFSIVTIQSITRFSYSCKMEGLTAAALFCLKSDVTCDSGFFKIC